MLPDTVKSFRLQGSINDEQGSDGDPKNIFDTAFRRPFKYGPGVLVGNSPSCRINIEYEIKKMTDISKAVP